MVFFTWPYLVFAAKARLPIYIRYAGSILFAAPFTLTLLHGHATLALGSAHRHLYYQWLQQHGLTYGLLFHPVLTTTRFRLILLVVSLLLFLTGWLLT